MATYDEIAAPGPLATIDPPRAIRVKTSTGWADIVIQGAQGLTGPQGAQGPQGATGATGAQGPAGPGVPAGGAIGRALMKTGAADYSTAWGLPMLAIQSVVGIDNGYSADFTVDGNWWQAYRDLAKTNPMRIGPFTPTVDAWWDVSLVVGLVAKRDAAYTYMYGNLRCSPNDVDGVGIVNSIVMQHSQVNTYDYRSIRKIFKLAANTAYVVDAGFTGGSGTWAYHTGPGFLWMNGMVWAR